MRLAVSMAELLALTATGALAVKPMLLAPDPIVTDGGTITAELPLLREMLVALVAAPLRLTVQEAVPGGVRLAGVHMRVDSAGGPPGAIRASVKFTETPLRLALSRAEPLTLMTVGALTVNPAMLDPAETVTDGGTLTDGLPLERVTLVELETTALIYTVQDDVAGGVKLAGVHRMLESVGVEAGLFKVSVKFLEAPFRLAVSRAVPFKLTADGALAVNPALLVPAETVTDAGTLTDVLPLVSATLVAPATAPLKFTVQDDVAGGVKLEGVHVRFDTVRSAWMIVIVAPVPVALIEAALASDAEAAAIEMKDEVLAVPAAI
ncbi:MAG TPA: hypothetical protein VNH83_12060 [Bryobacteraceae bacterium]|nr:hypothetical protein [Bryobacteraceae bacterium]